MCGAKTVRASTAARTIWEGDGSSQSGIRQYWQANSHIPSNASTNSTGDRYRPNQERPEKNEFKATVTSRFSSMYHSPRVS